MTGLLHMLKLSVGSDSVETLARFQELRRAQAGRLYHQTRMMPRRREELLTGGSIYWVIRGHVRARQAILDIEQDTDSDGRNYALLILDPDLIRTETRIQRPFQGWRYLEAADAPRDLASGELENGGIPPEMAAELRELGLL